MTKTFTAHIRILETKLPYSELNQGEWFCLENAIYAFSAGGNRIPLELEIYAKDSGTIAYPRGKGGQGKHIDPDDLVHRVEWRGVQSIVE